MRRIIRILLGASLLAGAVSCSDDKDSPVQEGPGPVEQPEPIGSYSFDGEDYDLFYAAFAEDEYDYYFVFSPLDGTSTLTTYVAIGLKKSLAEKEMDVTYIYHNDDYTFIFEDPVRLYSQYRQLHAGTIYVERNAQNNFTVKADVELYDGTPFRIDFKGEFTVPSSDQVE